MSRKTSPTGRTIERVLDTILNLKDGEEISLHQLQQRARPLIYYASLRASIRLLERLGSITITEVGDRVFVSKKKVNAPTNEPEGVS